MVGVPRSKGCQTCRRRKVACDQTKPHCQNCLKRGVNCEGYARYPTILQYTGSGLEKRPRFEEAKSSDPLALVSKPTRSHEGPSPPFPRTVVILPRQPDAKRLILDEVSVACLDTYLPHVGSGGAVAELKRNWMWMMLDMPDQGSALETSFAALCFARLGISKSDEDLLSRGRQQYALSLASLQRALQKPEVAFQERTLAAIRTLSIYELWAFKGPGVWNASVHEEGMAQWCLAAGPRCVKTEFALQVFHDVRWCIMNRAIDGRMCSALDTEEWRTLPWLSFPKDGLQQLFDLGFELAALLEQLDLAESLSPPEASVSSMANLALRCIGVQEALELWYSHHWQWREDQMPFCNAISNDTDEASTPEAASPEFESLWEATNMAYFWLFKMILHEILIATASEEEQEGLEFAMLDLAVSIVSASPYFLVDGTGWLGPQRIFFPLKRAMILLKSKQSPFAGDALEVFGKVVAKLRS